MEYRNQTLESHSLLKASEVAKILNVSRSFVYQLIQEGRLRSVKFNRVRRVRVEDLVDFIEASLSLSREKNPGD